MGNEIFKEMFARRVLTEMGKKNYSQRDLAEAAKIPVACLNGYIHGRGGQHTECGIVNLVKIADAVGVTTDYLLRGEKMEKYKYARKCGECVHYMSCAKCINPRVDACDAFEPRPDSDKKICPFERQAAIIGGGKCIREKCAWWSESLNNCIVFAHVWDAQKSLEKEINTVMYGGIVSGGED